MSETVVHRPTLRAGVRLFALFLLVAVVLGLNLPEQYPAHFNAAGQPTRYAEGPGMWILLVTFCVIAFGQGYLFQRYLVTTPPAPYLNVPYKKLFHRLPVDRQIPVLRRANRLLGLVNVGLVLTFLSILLLIYYAGHYPGSAAVSAARWVLWFVIALMVAVPLGETLVLRGMIKRKLREEGLLPGAEDQARAG